MKKIIFHIVLIVSISSSVFAQDGPINVTFFGSSVCRGAGAEDNHGYAWQFFHSGAIDTLNYKYLNASTGGDNTIKVEKEDRVTKKLFPTNPDIVVMGLSLGNEGIRGPEDDNGRERILEQYRSRLLSLIDSLDHLGIKPVIVNCYANTHFNASQYAITQRMNRIINTWKYPSVNVLGTIDDLHGKWVEGYFRDPLHPNTEGHREMSYAIVPSLFDAMLIGKPTPMYDWNKSFSTIKNDNNAENPLSLDLKHTMHSFSLSLRFKKATQGSIAGFTSDNTGHHIDVADNTLHYKTLSYQYENNDSWMHVVLSHSYANQKTMLFVNGELVGSVLEQLSPDQVYFGGTSSFTELKDITLHRSSLNESEAVDLFNKKFIQSSLEFYNPLTKAHQGTELENYAQSMSRIKLSDKVTLQHNKVQF